MHLLMPVRQSLFQALHPKAPRAPPALLSGVKQQSMSFVTSWTNLTVISENVLLKLDVENTFNSICPDTVLQERR